MTALRVLRLWFGFSGPIERNFYAASGLGLVAFKLLLDLLVTFGVTGRAMPLPAYFNPLMSQRLQALGPHPDWLPGLMIVYSLPLVWIGASMTVRRAVNAGLSASTGLLFFIPYINFFLMVVLAIAGSQPAQPSSPLAVANQKQRIRWAVVGRTILITAGLGVAATAFATLGLQSYGTSLFLGLPFVLGVVSGYLVNLKAKQDLLATWAVAGLAVTVCGGLLLLFALEGAMCLAMAAIPAYPLAFIGATLGGALASQSSNSFQSTGALVVAWPLLALLPLDGEVPLRSVVSSVEIAAKPEVVWRNVVSFSDLPPPDEWLMRAGIACPMRARIEGEGVGAVRYCEFTTGPFVEPITTWDPPHLLAFDVTQQPPSMKEWSPYEVVHAPHLVGNMQSQRGQFRLTQLPNGNTLLEGTTWYRLSMFPNAYWSLIADHAVHVIHLRVLRHILSLSETSADLALLDRTGPNRVEFQSDQN